MANWHRTGDSVVASLSPGRCAVSNNLGQVVHTHVPLLPSSIIWYWPMGGDALWLHGKVTAGLAKSNGSLYRWVDGLVTCGLTACTPGSARGPTLGNRYERTLPFYVNAIHQRYRQTDGRHARSMLVTMKCKLTYTTTVSVVGVNPTADL